MTYVSTEIEGKDDEKHQKSWNHYNMPCVCLKGIWIVFFFFFIAFTCMEKDSTLWQEIKGFGSLSVHVQQIKHREFRIVEKRLW